MAVANRVARPAQGSEAQIRQPFVVRGTRPRAIPMELALGLVNREVIDRSEPPLHKPIGRKFPVFVAV